MTSGSSVLTARPIASVFNEIPGPELDVMPSEPAYDAPIAQHMADISSSAWNVVTPNSLHARENVEQCGRGRNRVRSKEEFKSRKSGAGHEAIGQGVGPRHGPVETTRHCRGWDKISFDFLAQLSRLAECMACVDRRDVGIRDPGQLAEFFVQPIDRGLAVPAVQPIDQPQGPKFLHRRDCF